MADVAVVRWLQAGAVAAGVGAAMLAAPAIASADNGGGSAAPASHSARQAGAVKASVVGERRPTVGPRKVQASARPTADRRRPRFPGFPGPVTGVGNPTGNDDPSTSTEIVTGLFREILRADPTAEQLTRYTAVFDARGQAAVVNRLYTSTAFRQQQVNSYYLELLGRAPTAGELAAGTMELRMGVPEPLVVAQVASTREFYRVSGGTADTYVQLLYRSLLGEPADAGQAAIYVQELRSGRPTQVVAVQFIKANAFRAVKIQEIFQVVLGRAATDAEVASYLGSWIRNGGLAGTATKVLNSAENTGRMTTDGVPLPDMVAVDQLQQILMARYNEDPDGFVNLFNTYLKTDPVTGEQCPSTCNTPLLALITTGGLTRGIPNQAIAVTPITAAVSSLLPTQNEIDATKALEDPLQDPDLLEDYLAGGTVLAKSVILTADDGLYIVDGHHRWGGLYVINPYSQLSSIDLGYVPNAQEALKETQVAIVAEQGYLSAQTVTGDNLYTISKDDFDDLVEGLIDSGDDKDKILKIFKKEKDLTSMAQIQDYLWANVIRMRQFNEPVAGATSRGYMPQPPNSDYQPLMHWMENGALSYTMPVIGYVG
ncbi:hypothetical protein [Mycolicibacterium aichiense]|uniref:DUF4214 domain-containing protein n=1 Tax=Mycolicibacterium aichiense TaxID=1799 RepID=A0AAD1MEE0_9MYCO|nr:hypothetical protein [Mycolicibacterium aichiense]MCV7016681.1 hypothetical protein [Mycolicibacterium aichiense]BBX09540.1 hypothetical protein MAIC_43430 [Mycolicibacterium aichiense]SUA14105.1 Uncharacterised protein [Mycolicibacterium aichiense]